MQGVSVLNNEFVYTKYLKYFLKHDSMIDCNKFSFCNWLGFIVIFFFSQEKSGRPIISALTDEELIQMENMANRLTTLAEVHTVFLLALNPSTPIGD